MRVIYKNAIGFGCCFLLAIILSACGSSGQVSESASEMVSAMVSADASFPEYTLLTSDDADAELNFTSLSDFSYSKVAEYAYAYSSEGLAEEVAVVRLKDSSDAASFMNTLTKHVESRIGTMEAYAPDQVSVLENHILTHEGAYVCLIVSEKNGLQKSVFQDFFE